ncbi:MAG: hypothetical protein M3N56_10760 [Actinomycetota bacterium]|nr:hypothetical protein [Actinomycetota bacterium]
MHLIRLIRDCQEGFTTVTLMGVMAIGSLLVAGGFAAVDPDIGLSRDDQDHKQAYGAAEAGLQWYLSGLARDNSYYVKCTTVSPPSASEPAPVNDAWDGEGTDPRVWRHLPGGDPAEYTVELLPAPGYSACDPSDQYSMVDPDGNLRLRVTGRSRGQARSVVATLRRRNFIDYIYFTHFETRDPSAYETSSLRNWAQSNCSKFRQQRSGSCTEIQFAPDDFVRGPLHSNDSIWVCGGATFGRPENHDKIELNGASPGYVKLGSCNPTPQFDGLVIHPAGQLGMPSSNQALKTITQEAYRFEGRTIIDLQGDSMSVTRSNGVTEPMALPPNGVIYVENDICASGYTYAQTYPANASTGCGDAWVKGEYAGDLTIAADNDIVINGDLERDEDGEGLLLGLIANNFVRVYHPVTNPGTSSPSASNCPNAAGALSNPEIHAAILALNHSFVVDNWFCGADLGNLTVEGAIAQRYRGPVGTAGGTGYLKDYHYNDRLKFREPPYFLDPVQSAWRVARQNEQVPAND